VNKSYLTNSVALLFVLLGWWFGSDVMFMIGLFAFSGSVTNWLAVHMLFERVPLLYGSGVIERQFESIKQGIHALLMQQFFTEENLHRLVESESEKGVDLTPMLENADLSGTYDSLVEAVNESPFGNMLGMFGGTKALEPLKEPFEKKLRHALMGIVKSESFKESLQQHLHSKDHLEDLLGHIDTIVRGRLEELTPQIVKEIMESMIKIHLGWLVVWGGVFGGLIGALSTLVI